MQHPAVLSSDSQWDHLFMIPAGTHCPAGCWKDRQRLPSFLPLLFGPPVTELPDGGNIFQAIHTMHENYPRQPLYCLPFPLLLV